MGTTFKNFIPEDRTNDEIVGKTCLANCVGYKHHVRGTIISKLTKTAVIRVIAYNEEDRLTHLEKSSMAVAYLDKMQIMED